MWGIRDPDVLFQRSDALLGEVVTNPPLLCIEVLSPDDRMVDMQEKIDDYLAIGVTAIWVVNPRIRKVFVVDQVFAQLNAIEGDTNRK